MLQSTTVSTPRKEPYRVKPRWKKGESGNPKGRPKELEVWATIRRDLGDEAEKAAVSAAYRKMLKDGNAVAWKDFLDRVEGKPADHIKLDISVRLDQIPQDRLLEACERLGIAAPADLLGDVAPILDAEIVDESDASNQAELQKMQVVTQPTKNVCNIEERGIRSEGETDANFLAQVGQNAPLHFALDQNDTARNDPSAEGEIHVETDIKSTVEKTSDLAPEVAGISTLISTPIQPERPRKFTIVPPGRKTGPRA